MQQVLLTSLCDAENESVNQSESEWIHWNRQFEQIHRKSWDKDMIMKLV